MALYLSGGRLHKDFIHTYIGTYMEHGLCSTFLDVFPKTASILSWICSIYISRCVHRNPLHSIQSLYSFCGCWVYHVIEIWDCYLWKLKEDFGVLLMSLFEIGIGVHWCVCTYLYMYEPNIWVWEKHDHSTIWFNSIKLLVKFNHHFALLKFIMLKVSDSPHFPHFSRNE